MSDEVKIYQANQSQEANISLTDAAIKHITRYMQKQDQCIGIQLTVDTTGCSGLAYVVSMVNEAPENNWQTQIADINVFVPNEHINKLRGTQLDYVQDGLNQRFEYKNPNESGRCGCGESFTIED